MAMMSLRGIRRTGALKTILAVMALCLGAYILGPPLYWHLIEALGSSSCPSCNCHCDSLPLLLSFSQGLSNGSVTDCAKRDPEVSEDTLKNYVDLLSEDLKVREAEAVQNHQRADMALLEAKKMTSQYQKEADKCNSGMETCEEARETSERTLLAQKQLTATWELRARQRGWKGRNTVSQARTNSNTQAIQSKHVSLSV